MEWWKDGILGSEINRTGFKKTVLPHYPKIPIFHLSRSIAPDPHHVIRAREVHGVLIDP